MMTSSGDNIIKDEGEGMDGKHGEDGEAEIQS